MANRFWRYSREEWTPKHRWLPFKGNAEGGRATVVLPIPFSGYLVWAYWTCKCCKEWEEWTESDE